MATYHYQSIPYFADQWNKPDDPSNNAKNLKTGHGEVVRKRVESQICEAVLSHPGDTRQQPHTASNSELTGLDAQAPSADLECDTGLVREYIPKIQYA